MEAISGGAIIGGAALGFGVFFGFIFGIPRSRVSELKHPSSQSSSSEAEYDPNTNLEQISDWLTKILVGAGLTQLVKMPSQLGSLADYAADLFGGSDVPENSPFALGLILYFCAAGFLASYLLTRIRLPRLLRDSEVAHLNERLVNLNEEFKEVRNTAGYLPEMLSSLYAPKGFERTLTLGNELISQTGTPTSPQFWTYMAAAYGQQYNYVNQHEGAPGALEKIRKNALDAVKKAVGSGTAADEPAREWLRYIWDPNYKGKSKEDKEDDLELFYEDPDFKKLLGRPPDSSESKVL